MGIDLKSASRKDIDKLMPLFKGLYELYGGDIGPHFAEVLQEYVDSENHLTMVALSDGDVVGVLIGSYRLDIDYECRAGFVDAIVVDEGFQKRGIGKRLLHHFAQWAQSKKCTVLHYKSLTGIVSSLSIYGLRNVLRDYTRFLLRDYQHNRRMYSDRQSVSRLGGK